MILSYPMWFFFRKLILHWTVWPIVLHIFGPRAIGKGWELDTIQGELLASRTLEFFSPYGGFLLDPLSLWLHHVWQMGKGSFYLIFMLLLIFQESQIFGLILATFGP